MLTAQNTPNDTLTTGAASTVSGFGNVLKSIQGLQQRLSDFSIDEVSVAEANANNLMHRITFARQKLIELAALKHNLTAVADMLRQIPEIDFNLISPNSLERHPQLHAIVKTSKIIRLHRLLKVAKASAQSVSFDSEVGRLEIGTPLAPTIAATRAEKYPEKLSRTSTEQPSKAAVSWQSTDGVVGVIELPPPPPIIHADTDHALPTGTETGTGDEEIAELLTQSSSTSLIVENPEKLDERKDASVVPEPVAVSGAGRPAARADSILDVDTLTSDHEFPPLTAPKTEPIDRAVPSSKTAPEFEDERSSAVSNSAFNQRLIDDLIQNYGEFFATPEPSAKPVAIHVDIPIAREPNFVEKEPVAVVEQMTVETAKATVPSTRSHGELDRQLKKIIKDYGEYDIYSHQSSLTLKKSGIAAFVVLALILAAVYFFRHSPQTISGPVPAAQHDQTSPSIAPGSSKETSSALTAGANQKTDNSSDPTASRKMKQKQKL